MTTLRKLVQALHRPIPTVGPFAVAVLVLAALPVTPDLDTARVTLTALHAQPPGENCSRCVKCSKCVRSPWGGGYCTYEGGCCREEGGNCNPALALSVPPSDSRAYGEDENLVVRANRERVWHVDLCGRTTGGGLQRRGERSTRAGRECRVARLGGPLLFGPISRNPCRSADPSEEKRAP